MPIIRANRSFPEKQAHFHFKPNIEGLVKGEGQMKMVKLGRARLKKNSLTAPNR